MTLIAISGPSSSGKSTIIKTINHLLNNYTLIKSSIVHLDDYYFDDDKIPLTKGVQNWDCIEAIDYESFMHDLKNNYSTYPSIEPEITVELSEGEKDLIIEKLLKLSVLEIKLVDGFLLFHSKSLQSLFDLKIFVFSSFTTLKSRREARSHYTTNQGSWIDPPLYFDNIVWPEFKKNHEKLFIETGDKLSPLAKQWGIWGLKNENLSLFELIDTAVDLIVENL